VRLHTKLGATLLGLLAATALPVSSAHGHIGEFDSFGEAMGAWKLDPLVIVPLVLLSAVYLRGAARVLRAVPGGGRYGWRVFAYGAGVLVLVVALLSPLDALSGMYVSAHMTQHLLLMQIAAPLLVFGAPMVVATVGSRRLRKLGVRVRRWRPGMAALLLAPLSVLILHAVALLAWHLPVLYNLALISEGVHFLQHVAFLSTAVLFWWAVLPSPGRRAAYPVSLGLVFVMAVVSGGLGALMTVAPAPWYDYQVYAGFSPLQDQQLAGAIMWVIGGTMYAATAVTCFVLWVRKGEALDDTLAPTPTRASDAGAVVQGAGGPR
jgi:putative membrane protein